VNLSEPRHSRRAASVSGAARSYDQIDERFSMKRRKHSDPKHWRARAAEMRAVAAQVTDPKVKATTSGAADGYDKLAHMEEMRTAESGRRREIHENPIE
jgi:hypothetical protein